MKIVVALAAFVLAAAANAAGLGRLTVMSALGQPLLAEIEIVALQPGEEDGLSARLAPLEAFTAAGVEINAALSSMRISIERRDKRPLLRLTTQQPVNEPFLDLLIELSWNTGKLVREYTFLLDPPEYRSRQQAIAAAPTALPPMAEKPAATPPAPQPEPKPAVQAPPAPIAAPAAPAAEPQPAPAEPKPAAEPPSPVVATPAAPAAPEKPAAPGATTYEVKRGDTLGAIAKQHMRPGVTLNQMLIAIFRANEDAFIRGNVNLVRTGKILNIPEVDAVGTVDRDEANRLMKDQYAQFNEYRARLAAVPTSTEAGQQGREVAGRIDKPEAPKPPAPADQLRLSKTEPAKPGATAPGAPSDAARADDAAARARELQEAQSRIAQLERNVADQQKLLAMRNQQLAELEKKGGAKPAPEAPKPAAEAPKPAAPAPKPEAPKPAPEAPKPAAEAPKPAAPAPAPAKPAAEPAKPAAEAPKPAAPAAPAKPAAPKPAAKAPPPPEPSLIDEFLDNPMYLALLGALVLLLIGYGWWTWRRKKMAQAKFQDSVLGAAAATSAGGTSLAEPTAPPSGAGSTVSQQASTAPAGMEAEEVDPIAEADVYMAYGRDAQAEEILKEALQKDSSRTAVHGKLLEIYAHRKDTKAFEQTALKLKNLTNGTGPEWEKAATLGRSIDPNNSSYAGAAPAADAPSAPAAAPAAAAPTLDFDLGGAAQAQASAPDISLDDAGKGAAPGGLDFDLGSTQGLKPPEPAAPAAVPEETVLADNKDASAGLDFNLDLGSEEKKPEPAKAAPAPAPKKEEASGGLDFDLNLDIDKPAAAAPVAEPSKVDLSAISLDLGTADATVMAAKPSSDPKWQEVATKLDLAKAYEEMGDKDGARELLKEVMKDGDAAQRGSAEQLLAKLG